MSKKQTVNSNKIIDECIFDDKEFQESFLEEMKKISKEEPIPFEKPDDLFD